MEKEKIDLSIVILSYNSKADLAGLLPSVFASKGVSFSTPPREEGKGEVIDAEFDAAKFTKTPSNSPLKKGGYEAEVIVVDNGSGDGTPEWLISLFDGRQKVILIQNQNNGFAHGNNLGIRQAQGKYVLILNPDTEFRTDTLQVMLEFMESRPDVGISTCKVLLPDGKLDLACKRRFPNPRNSFKRLFLGSNSDYNLTSFDDNQEMEVDSVMGAFMLIRKIRKSDRSENRKSDLSDTSDQSDFPMFDEAFFMYGEDIDLCWRVKEAGYKVWYYPKTSITHYKGSASLKAPYKALKWFHGSMWIFYKKHYKNRYPFVFNWLVWLAIELRFWILVLLNFFRKEKFVSKR